VPFLVYTLQWSTIYPPLKLELVQFYLFSFGICILLGLITLLKKRTFNYHKINQSNNNNRVIAILYSFYVIDILYSGFIPLIAFSKGHAEYGGSIDYGIPVLHVLVVTFNLFYTLYVFHQLLSNPSKKLIFKYLMLILPFVILLQRSNIMYIIIGSFFIYLLSIANFSFPKMVYVVVAGFVSFYAFGYLGNLRSAGGDSTFIPLSSGVTDKFLKGPVPNEFYWGYLYVGSPLANLQNNINLAKDKTSDYEGLIVNEFMPDFLGKRLSSELSIKPRAFEQINPFLNVGTIYARPFNYAGWGGLITMFLYFITLMNIYYIFIERSYTYGVTGIAMMCVAIALANFENTIQYSAYSFQLIYPLILSVIKKYRLDKSKLNYENRF
jgi:hypothetical protein